MRKGIAQFLASKLAILRLKNLVWPCVIAIVFVAHSVWSERKNQELSQGFQRFQDSTGQFATLSTNGFFDLDNPFFRDLGSNGRKCVTCHQPNDGWTIIPAHVRERFETSRGHDPIFRTNDGSNSPDADVSTLNARNKAYSMLLSKGLIRVGLPIPANAEFSLTEVDDPYGFASAKELSLFRRPLPATNVRFLSTVMWDGRETFPGLSIHDDLMHQANSATEGHAQAIRPLTKRQREAIVDFQMASHTTQIIDNEAGDLRTEGARGGPSALSHQKFFIGINDPLGQNPSGQKFDRKVFSIFEKWASPNPLEEFVAMRRSVARGQKIFNTRNFNIRGVGGLNDLLGKAVIIGNCTLCHDTPNMGNHSVPAPLNIGLTDVSRRTPDLPLYTLKCNSGPMIGQTIQTTDPGRALVTGKCEDIGKFKGPTLRALSSRAPYFHNGSAETLEDVVKFYNKRFKIGFNPDEIQDLVHFLQSL